MNKQWPDHFQQLAAQLPGVEMTPKPQGVHPWTVTFLKTGGLPLLYDFIKLDNLVEIFDLVRRDRFEELVNDPGLIWDGAAAFALVNLAEMAILMSGKWAVEQDDIENHGLSGRWETNLPEIEKEWDKETIEIATGKRHVFSVDIDRAGVQRSILT